LPPKRAELSGLEVHALSRLCDVRVEAWSCGSLKRISILEMHLNEHDRASPRFRLFAITSTHNPPFVWRREYTQREIALSRSGPKQALRSLPSFYASRLTRQRVCLTGAIRMKRWNYPSCFEPPAHLWQSLSSVFLLNTLSELRSFYKDRSRLLLLFAHRP
jgi:hypothetical protein